MHNLNLFDLIKQEPNNINHFNSLVINESHINYAIIRGATDLSQLDDEKFTKTTIKRILESKTTIKMPMPISNCRVWYEFLSHNKNYMYSFITFMDFDVIKRILFWDRSIIKNCKISFDVLLHILRMDKSKLSESHIEILIYNNIEDISKIENTISHRKKINKVLENMIIYGHIDLESYKYIPYQFISNKKKLTLIMETDMNILNYIELTPLIIRKLLTLNPDVIEYIPDKYFDCTFTIGNIQCVGKYNFKTKGLITIGEFEIM